MKKYEESSTVELKQEVTPDIKKGIIALANTDGGTIYVGVDPQPKRLDKKDVHTKKPTTVGFFDALFSKNAKIKIWMTASVK